MDCIPCPSPEMTSKRTKTSPPSASPMAILASNGRPTLATILCIPELQEHVIAYLSLQDRARLLLTNKHMSTEMLPFLWRDIPSKAAARLLHNATLEEYVHLIQSIDFSKSSLGAIVTFSRAALNSKSIQQSNDDLIWASGQIHRLKTSDRPSKEEQPQQRYGLRRLCFQKLRYYPGSKRWGATWPFLGESQYEGSTLGPTEGSYFHQYCRVLRTSPRLTHLAIPASILARKQDTYQRLFLGMITKNNLPYLQSLIITSSDSFCSEPISLNIGLMILCRALELKDLVELRCGFEILSNKSQSEITSSKEEKYQEERAMSFQNCLTTLQTRDPDQVPRRLKTLLLPNTLWPLEFLIPFFTNYVSGLERLAVPWLNRNCYQASIAGLVNAIRGSSPSIQHIEAVMTSRLRDESNTELSIQALVLAAVGGQSLVSFETYNVSWAGFHFHQLLLHQPTLERIVSEDRFHLGDAGLTNIIETCPNLKVVHAPWFKDRHLAREIVKSSLFWKCKGLTTLCVTMGDSSTTTTLKAAHYSALGKLSQLRDLTLGYSSPIGFLDDDLRFTDLMLKNELEDGLPGGYLELLEGLRELRRLCLMQDFWTCLTMAEIRFMARNWPRLESITFVTNDEEWLGKYLEVIGCWRELKTLLPGIKYTVLHMI